jgi:hypothetical protein
MPSICGVVRQSWALLGRIAYLDLCCCKLVVRVLIRVVNTSYMCRRLGGSVQREQAFRQRHVAAERPLHLLLERLG